MDIYVLAWHNYQNALLHERNKIQDCVCGYSSHENIPFGSPADGKINTHSYKNVPFTSPADGKINIGNPNTILKIYHNFHSNTVLPMAYSGPANEDGMDSLETLSCKMPDIPDEQPQLNP